MHPSNRPDVMTRRELELQAAETRAQVINLQRQWAEEDAALLAIDAAVEQARSKPVTNARSYPPFDTLIEAIGGALGKSRAETKQELRAELAALEAKVTMLEQRTDVGAALAKLAERDAILERLQVLLEALVDGATPKAKTALARLRQ